MTMSMVCMHALYTSVHIIYSTTYIVIRTYSTLSAHARHYVNYNSTRTVFYQHTYWTTYQYRHATRRQLQHFIYTFSI